MGIHGITFPISFCRHSFRLILDISLEWSFALFKTGVQWFFFIIGHVHIYFGTMTSDNFQLNGWKVDNLYPFVYPGTFNAAEYKLWTRRVVLPWGDYIFKCIVTEWLSHMSVIVQGPSAPTVDMICYWIRGGLVPPDHVCARYFCTIWVLLIMKTLKRPVKSSLKLVTIIYVQRLLLAYLFHFQDYLAYSIYQNVFLLNF